MLSKNEQILAITAVASIAVMLGLGFVLEKVPILGSAVQAKQPVSAAVTMQKETAGIQTPWLASIMGYSSQTKYKISITNTGQINAVPKIAAAIRPGACPVATSVVPDSNWKLEVKDTSGNSLALASGSVVWQQGSAITPGQTFTYELFLISPAKGSAQTSNCLKASFADVTSGTELDTKEDTVTVTTPQGTISLEWLQTAAMIVGIGMIAAGFVGV